MTEYVICPKWKECYTSNNTYNILCGHKIPHKCANNTLKIKDRSMIFLGCPACVPCNKEGKELNLE